MGAITLPVRSEIHQWAQHGLTDRQIAERLSLSASTVRKWRRRFNHFGRPGLTSALGRPANGVLSSLSLPVVA